MGAVGTSIASALSRIYYSTGLSFADSVLQAFAFRPPQWASGVPALTMTATDPTTGKETVYVFDAIIRAEHNQASVITLNPVQTGAPLTDHAYVIPPRLSIEIRMSDAMQSYTLGQWADGPSKSVSAYQKLVALQQQRLPMSVATRLRQYDNMVITDLRAEEEVRTEFGLRAFVTFTQILTASIENTNSTISYSLDPANSALPQVTGQTIIGQANTLPVPPTIQAQNYTSALSSVAGAGSWGSSIIGAAN